jgi:electron transport complex protein RnfB
LAQLLDHPILPLDASCGVHVPLKVAVIDEQFCIGCTLCIQACPVDAILGASKVMHTIIAADCTGCDLCVAPCPVDCIDMVNVEPPRTWTQVDADQARARYERRITRLNKTPASLRSTEQPPLQTAPIANTTEDKRTAAQAALARARARRNASTP